MKGSNKMWKQIAQEAQALRDETLAKVGVNTEIPAQLSRNVTDIPDKILSASSTRITSLAPQEIITLVSERKVSAQEVVQAFLERAVIAQNLASHLFPFVHSSHRQMLINMVDKLPHRTSPRTSHLSSY